MFFIPTHSRRRYRLLWERQMHATRVLCMVWMNTVNLSVIIGSQKKWFEMFRYLSIQQNFLKHWSWSCATAAGGRSKAKTTQLRSYSGHLRRSKFWRFMVLNKKMLEYENNCAETLHLFVPYPFLFLHFFPISPVPSRLIRSTRVQTLRIFLELSSRVGEIYLTLDTKSSVLILMVLWLFWNTDADSIEYGKPQYATDESMRVVTIPSFEWHRLSFVSGQVRIATIMDEKRQPGSTFVLR